MTGLFADYIDALRRTPLGEHTEHTGRSALQVLLDTFAGTVEANVQHEPKRVAEKGAPDFKISRQGMVLGYVETKPIGDNLDKVLKSDQIKRYRELSDNILLTDYLHFVWIDGDDIHREILCHATDLENSKFTPGEAPVAGVSSLLEAFFSTAPEGIGRAQNLALALATRSKLLRDYMGEELVRQGKEHQEGRLYGLYTTFRDQVFQELTLAEFADAFAQMLAYGLFLARLNAEGDEVTLFNAREHIPRSFRLIRELVDFLTELEKDEYREIRWVVEEVLSIVNGLDLPAIHEDLSFRQRKAISRDVRATDEDEHRLFERDPFIYFYEDYLKAYDPEMRKGRGVYYTPPPIVNFIIRAVDDVLKDTFGISDGLADHQRVTVLDFACGTGTFLLEVFQRIFENIGGPDSGRGDLIVQEHILKNLYGFEYLIAPYTIAHLKLSQYLHEQGHALRDDERLQIFLTNTLEPVEPQANLLLPAVSAEVEAAQRVKEQPILVITGNPPYSGHSKNKGKWIKSAIDEYKFTWETNEDGLEERKPLGERNPKWLQDDYVKFLRFAQMKMDGYSYTTAGPDGELVEHSVPGVEQGMVAVITNHSWLDNPTFRGMRQSLMRTFDQIYVLDLHGSTKKKETTPDGSRDENVFDIEQGVAISLFIKCIEAEQGVWRGDLWGKRLEKYEAAASTTHADANWTQLDPDTPFYLFAWQDKLRRDQFESFSSLNEIYAVRVLGFQTHRDAFALSFSQTELAEKLRVFSDPQVPDEDIVAIYGIRSNRDWSLPNAREAAQLGEATNNLSVAYRPFDHRWSEYSSVTMDYPRRELLDHVAGRSNLCLLAPRQIGTQYWRHGFIADRPAESCLVSSDTKSQNYVFPSVFYSNETEIRENLSPEFREFIDGRYDHHYTPEEILGYIYAVLHAPTYRERFAEFLRIDFPRIPFPEEVAGFERLSALGWGLVQAHLERELPRRGLGGYAGQGSHEVERVRYSPEEDSVWINADQRFENVPSEVWEFYIGGYQVIDKYLKSRKGRPLSLDEINHVGAIADILAFTIDRMAEIDEAYGEAFPDA